MQKIDPDFNPIEVGKLTVVSESMHSIFNFLNPTDDGSEVQLAGIERAEEEFYGNSTTTIDQEDTNNNNERKSGNVTEYIGQDSLVSEMSMIMMSPTDNEFKRGVSTQDDDYWNSDKPSESLQPTDYIMPNFSRPHVYFSFPRDF